VHRENPYVGNISLRKKYGLKEITKLSVEELERDSRRQI
jgi:hypothetical protein